MLEIPWCLGSMGQKKKKNLPLFQSEYIHHNCFFFKLIFAPHHFSFSTSLISFLQRINRETISGLNCSFTKKEPKSLWILMTFQAHLGSFPRFFYAGHEGKGSNPQRREEKQVLAF